jgi:hypothetical protein
VKETVARTLFDTIRAALPPETSFILVLQDDEDGGFIGREPSECL